MRATDKSDVNVLLCLKEEKNEYDTSYYGATKKYKCTQYERDLIACGIEHPQSQKKIRIVGVGREP